MNSLKDMKPFSQRNLSSRHDPDQSWILTGIPTCKRPLMQGRSPWRLQDEMVGWWHFVTLRQCVRILYYIRIYNIYTYIILFIQACYIQRTQHDFLKYVLLQNILMNITYYYHATSHGFEQGWPILQGTTWCNRELVICALTFLTCWVAFTCGA